MRFEIFKAIAKERFRQEKLMEAGKFAATCATTGERQMTDAECLAVLGEEVGEVFDAFNLARALGRVSRAVNEGFDGNSERGRTDLRKELVEVCAVAVAWLERLQKEESAR